MKINDLIEVTIHNFFKYQVRKDISKFSWIKLDIGIFGDAAMQCMRPEDQLIFIKLLCECAEQYNRGNVETFGNNSAHYVTTARAQRDTYGVSELRYVTSVSNRLEQSGLVSFKSVTATCSKNKKENKNKSSLSSVKFPEGIIADIAAGQHERAVLPFDTGRSKTQQAASNSTKTFDLQFDTGYQEMISFFKAAKIYSPKLRANSAAIFQRFGDIDAFTDWLELLKARKDYKNKSETEKRAYIAGSLIREVGL